MRPKLQQTKPRDFSPEGLRRHSLLLALLLLTAAVSIMVSISQTEKFFEFTDRYYEAGDSSGSHLQYHHLRADATRRNIKPEDRPIYRLSYFGRVGVNSISRAASAETATSPVSPEVIRSDDDVDDDEIGAEVRDNHYQHNCCDCGATAAPSTSTSSSSSSTSKNASTSPRRSSEANRWFRYSPSRGRFTADCEQVAGDEPLAQTWRRSARVACRVNNPNNNNNSNNNPGGHTTTTITVTEHLLAHLDAKPSLRVYENVYLKSFVGPVLGTGCPGDSTHLIDEEGNEFRPDWVAPFVKPPNSSNGAPNTVLEYGFDDPELTLVRILRFAPGNPFEAFHAYLNTYLMLRALELNPEKTRFVFQDTLESTQRDDEFWNSFSLNKQPPIYRYAGRDDHSKRRVAKKHNEYVFARRVIQGFSTGISVLVSSAAPLSGRGAKHSCTSSWAQNATKWMRRNFELLGRLPKKRWLSPMRIQRHQQRRQRIEVVWCSRSVHPRAGGKLLIPHRVMTRETEFVLALRNALGPDVHLRAVDFSKLDGPQSIRAAETASVMIGFHGAGLTWSMFMKPSDSAVIELFGDDRSPENFHYRNLCSLMDFHHIGLSRRFHFDPYSWEHWPVEGQRGKALVWTNELVATIGDVFHNLPFEVKVRKPKISPY